MLEQKEKKNRLAEVFTKDYKYEGLVLLILAIVAIVLGVYFLNECYTLSSDGTYNNPFGGAFILGDYPKVFSWILTVLGVVSLLLSIWPYYKPSVYEVKRVSWPSKKELLGNTITTFIFVIIFVIFFFLVDAGLLALIDAIKPN